MVFGTAQTINSAMFYINEATSLVQRFCGPEGVQVLLGKGPSPSKNQGPKLLITIRANEGLIHGSGLRRQ